MKATATSAGDATSPGFRIDRLSPGRLAVLDLVRFASRRPTMHGLIEADITGVRKRLAARDETVTAFVAASIARLIGDFPNLNARRAGRKLVVFQKVGLVVTVEDDAGGAPIPFVVADASDKTPREITAEIRAARRKGSKRDPSRRSLMERLPSGLRRIGVAVLSRFPTAVARFGPPVGVSSLGMFGSGWGIPVSPMTLMVTVGGAVERPVLAGERVENHEFLPLTLSFDHGVVDGAPAARFANRLCALLETATVLDEEGDCRNSVSTDRAVPTHGSGNDRR